MNDLGNKYALAALRDRRAQLAGLVRELEGKARKARQSLVHVDATLRLFDPEADPSAIAAKRPYKRVKLFGSGKLNRLILDVLREADRPMATLEVVESIIATLGYGPEVAKRMKGSVRSNLAYLVKARGLVVKEGNRETAKWELGVDSRLGVA